MRDIKVEKYKENDVKPRTSIPSQSHGNQIYCNRSRSNLDRELAQCDRHPIFYVQPNMKLAIDFFIL